MSTSAVVADVVDSTAGIERYLSAAAAIAAPVVMVGLPDELQLWSPTTGQAVMSVSYGDAPRIVERLARLSPDLIERVKNRGYQTTLFPIDIASLSATRNRISDYLSTTVEDALLKVKHLNPTLANDLVTKLVIGALAALTIRDKQAVSVPAATGGAGVLVDVVQQRFPGYFDWLTRLSPEELETFAYLVDGPFSGVGFASLEPAMISSVYENVLRSRAQRSAHGTFYTPPELAQQMLRVVPFEILNPDHRYVLDPACGSATMLLAAASRLNDLQPIDFDAQTKHNYLTSHLRGYDQDAFAVEVAKLCMLISALPIGNSWHIEKRDSQVADIKKRDRPSLIVSNPPWAYLRSGVSTAERANQFLSWMVENVADEGFVACVMPLSWMNRNNSRRSRSELLERASLLEVWRLPDSVFPGTSSKIAPCVIVAQRSQAGHREGESTLVKWIRQEPEHKFYPAGLADEAYLVEPGKDGEHLMRGPLTRFIEEELDDFARLDSVTDIHNGRPRLPGRAKRSKSEANTQEIGSLRVVPSFGAPDRDHLPWVKYPDDYDHPSKDPRRLASNKVLVTAKRFSSRDPWKINAGYDPYGLPIREMLHSIHPNPAWEPWAQLTEEQRMYAVLAVVGSGFVSAWLSEVEPTPNLSTRRIAAIPFPRHRADIERLADTGRRAALSAGSAASLREKAVLRLESVINDVFRVTPEVKAIVAARLAGAPDASGIVRYAAPAQSQHSHVGSLPSVGTVLSASENGFTIWVSGVTNDDGVSIAAPLQAPGWLCRPDRDFVIRNHSNGLESADYDLHRNEWMPTDISFDPSAMA